MGEACKNSVYSRYILVRWKVTSKRRPGETVKILLDLESEDLSLNPSSDHECFFVTLGKSISHVVGSSSVK